MLLRCVQASSAVGAMVSLDCSLPDNGISKSIQKVVITCSLPGEGGPALRCAEPACLALPMPICV